MSLACHHVLAAASPLAMDECCPGLRAPGSAEETQEGNSMANHDVLAAASWGPATPTPGPNGDGHLIDLNTSPMSVACCYHDVLVEASPLAKDESRRSRSTTRSNKLLVSLA